MNKNISDLGSGLNLFKVNKNLINALDNFSSDCAFNVYLLIYLVKIKPKSFGQVYLGMNLIKFRMQHYKNWTSNIVHTDKRFF